MTTNSRMICPQCGVEMNHHCDKVVYTPAGDANHVDGAIAEFHTCPKCGGGASRRP